MREREVLHSDLSRGSKLLTGDNGGGSVRDIGDDEESWTRYSESAWPGGDGLSAGFNRDGIGSPC